MKFAENNVPAKGQMKAFSKTRYYGSENAPFRVLIIGNSITLHAPAPSIDWHGEWGMAASSEENDYVHLLMKKVKEDGQDVRFCIRQGAEWEVALNENRATPTVFAEEKAFSPDVVIFRLVENVKGFVSPDDFYGEAKRLLAYLVPPQGTALLTTSFWGSHCDGAIRRIAKEEGYALSELADLQDDPAMRALGLFSHEGVCVHPGDRGMAAIADRLFPVLQTLYAPRTR